MLKSAKQSQLRSAACGCIGQNNNKSDTKDKMMKMIFDSKNKVAGIFVSN